MSLETIQVFRDFNLINGYVQVQPNREGEKTAHTPTAFLAAVSDSIQMRLAHPDTNPTTGRGFGSQEFIRVPDQTFNLDL